MQTSVALCTYNGQRFLGEQLQSLLRQHRRPDELVVCDDTSTDDTLPIIEDFQRHSPFPVRLYRNPQRQGYAKNFSQALSRCTGDLIFPCDQDDVWDPGKIATLSRVLEQHDDVALVACDSNVVNHQLQPLWAHPLATQPIPLHLPAGYRTRPSL